MRASRFSVIVALIASPLFGSVQLPHLFSDHVVLQRERPIHVWGWADPGEHIAVAMANANHDTVADALGKWSVYLPPKAAGGPYTLTVSGSNTLSITDVMVGDVWFASGQSNMEMPLAGFPGDGKINNSAEEIRNANQPHLRLLRIAKRSTPYPSDDYEQNWTTCTPETAAQFSAVAYFFGREIADRERVTVGLIDSTWGGTPAEAWTSFEGLSFDSALMPVFASWGRMASEQADAPRRKAADRRADEEAQRTHQPKPKHPWQPDPASYSPSALFNGMVAPAIPFGIRGVIWYQGEANASVDRAGLYDKLFPAMITDWRRHWAQGDFPFFFVQLANYKAGENEQWPTVREAQRRALALANTGMAVAIDIGNPDDIHPGNKQAVGNRLALAARGVAYREPVEYQGPMFRQATMEGDAMRIWFNSAEGLHSKLASESTRLPGFEIAGSDRRYMAADARIEGENVIVNSRDVHQPCYVRYAWRDNPEVALYNSAKLPAPPFSSEPLILSGK